MEYQGVDRHIRIYKTHCETDCFRSIRNIRLKLLLNNQSERRYTDRRHVHS